MEEKKKRKTKTSTAVKRRYNEKMYTLITASLPKEMASRFKAACVARGIPQTQVIKRAITAFLAEEDSEHPS